MYRRNRATLYIEQGVPLAVNVGDAMNAISIGSLTENIPVLGAELAYRIFHEAQHLVLQSVEGQALELGWTRDNIFDLTEDDYLRLVLKKTCWWPRPARTAFRFQRGHASSATNTRSSSASHSRISTGSSNG